MSPRLEKVTPANVAAALDIEVRPDQRRLVAPVATSLAEAYAHGETAWPRLIYDGDRLVGFLMAFLDIQWEETRPDDIRSGLWRLNIAADQQGRGYGRFAVRSVADEVRRRGRDRMYVTWHPGDDGPERFYQKLGFRITGEHADGETVGELLL
ncbi:GNAT family N-acetyltransferase [Plantactinospora sp. GCM10030261]|uniref:GNAT family N-acetyltransferase n=1 Tax=Plantactinospora sp. GCM10030261 TaxID=3273420 RepID=UPI0036223720